MTEPCGIGQGMVPVLDCSHLSLCGDGVLKIRNHRDTIYRETWVPEADIILTQLPPVTCMSLHSVFCAVGCSKCSPQAEGHNEPSLI